jgi:hypothetical protein
MRKALLLLLTTLFAINGLAMLIAPESWYHAISTVPHTGPFNAHFVRDIGCAYLASAGSLAYFALDAQRGRPAALTGVAFQLLHGLVHVWDVFAGRATFEHFSQDVVGVLAVPALALWLVCWRAKSPEVRI